MQQAQVEKVNLISPSSCFPASARWKKDN
ncbi:hypothetical protein [Paenibacillus jilunlii]